MLEPLRKLTLPAVLMLASACVPTADEAAPDQESQTPDSEIPDYTVLGVVDQLQGGTYGDVLTFSLSRETPAVERTRIARKIAEREGFQELSLYCSREAWEANFSAEAQEKYPNALSNCLLGSLKGREFTPGESVFP